MFSSMPTEIIQNVFDILPISDCKSIVDAYDISESQHKRMKGIHDDRTSLTRYFTRNLTNGDEMMKLLAQTDSYLFGSRAIEFFVPGMSECKSNWNFYISQKKEYRYHFMKTMESLGVKWKHVVKTFLERLGKGSVSIVVKQSELALIIKESKKMKLTDFQKYAIRSFETEYVGMRHRHRTDRTLLFFGMIGTDSFECRDITNENEESDFFNMTDIEGTFNIKGKDVKIEVTFVNDPGYGHIEMLHDVCFSIQQCFISGFGALHMYGKLASSSVSYRWDRTEFNSDNSNLLRTNELAHKYTLRGCQIRCRPYNERTIKNQRAYHDNESIYIPFHNVYGWNKNIWKLFKMKSCYMQWFESKFDTYFQYTKYSNYFSQHFMDQCDEFRKSMIMTYDETYLLEYGALL